MTTLANWVEELTTTTGVGDVTLGTDPITGSTTFLQGFGSGVTSDIPYAIRSGNNRESGIGSFNGTTQVLTRTTVLSTLVNGVYNDTSPPAINLTGTSTVSCAYIASLYTSTGIPEAPDDSSGYVRRGDTSNDWQQGSIVSSQTTEPTSPAFGDVWIDTT